MKILEFIFDYFANWYAQQAHQAQVKEGKSRCLFMNKQGELMYYSTREAGKVIGFTGTDEYNLTTYEPVTAVYALYGRDNTYLDESNEA